MELPPKKWFGSLSEDVIRERQIALEAYLNHLLRVVDPFEFAALATFLDLFANVVRVMAAWRASGGGAQLAVFVTVCALSFSVPEC